MQNNESIILKAKPPGFIIWLGLALFVLTLVMGYTEETLVDYDSGAEREVHAIWGIKIFKKPLPETPFAALKLSNGLKGLTGIEDWHRIDFDRKFLIFKKSAMTEGDDVSASMADCSGKMIVLDEDEAIQLKEELLRALSSGGPSAARQTCDKWTLRVINH